MTPVTTHNDRSDVAIVGMSCRAAGVETLADLWAMLAAAEQRFDHVPPDRWYGLDPDLVTTVPRASLVNGIDQFDARFFGIAPRMAAWMDPQHRLMLELAWHAVENAGINPDNSKDESIAVFVGAFMADYRERMNAMRKSDSAAFPGTLMAFLANRISYQFGWTGPSMVIDSACSSSLQALGLAVQGLRHGEYRMALVGSPNLFSAGYYTNNAYRGGALSPAGASVPFSAARDGYVRGEGGACVLLEPLSEALANGHPVHAVIRAVGSAHNGRGGGLTGTDPESQLRLIQQTTASAGCAVRDLGYVEAHGSGTPAGDAVELEALARALRDPGEQPTRSAGPGGKLWVGSIKASIGHLEGAAGLIGLIKAVLVMRHGRIPRIAGLTTADPQLPIGEAPVAIAVEDVPWPADGSTRLAAVNSFGLGGAMSHVVVEEPPAFSVGTSKGTAGASTRDGSYVVPLSAADEASLRVLAERLLQELDGGTPSLPSVAWTMQQGRRDRPERRVLSVRDVEDLRAALRAVATGEPASCEDESELVRTWLKGEQVDWAELWTEDVPVRAHLPGSVFDRRSYWFDERLPG